MLLARSHQRASTFRSAADVCVVASLMALMRRLGHGVELVHREMLQHLLRARWPVDDDAVHPITATDSEMKTSIVLAGEAHPAIHDPPLRQTTRLDHHLGADRASVASRPH